MDAKTIGIDLAKDVFEIAISVRPGEVTGRRRLTRRQFGVFIEGLAADAHVVMEACGTSQYWARRCQARGAHVTLLPAQYVRPYVRRNKTDRTDAEALLEAHRCGGLHAVPVKTVEQQAIQTLHRVRQQWQRTRTARINALRAVLREHGVPAPAGARALTGRVEGLVEDADAPLPAILRPVLRALVEELRHVQARLTGLDRQLDALVRTHPIAHRLHQVPGVGPITATALVGSVPHIGAFHRGRQFASWVGLTPRETSSGLTRRLGGISKRGDPYLRTLLIHGGRALLRAAETRRIRQPETLTSLQRWGLEVAGRRGRNRAAVALANKLARIVWVVWSRPLPDLAPAQL